MQKFTILGPSGRNNSVSSAIFRDAVDGRLPEARYFPIDALFRGSSLLTSALTSNRLKQRMARSPLLRALLSPARDAAFRSARRVTLRRVDAAPSDGGPRYFIFCPSTHIERISPQMLDDLRRRCDNCHPLFYFIDSVERTALACDMRVEAVLELLEHFDAAYTYDKVDAARYPDHLRFVEIPLWRAPLAPPAALDAELYFCGRNKRRGALLTSVHRRLGEAGLRCHLRIPGMDPRGFASLPGAVQGEAIPYDQMIAELLRANCILEVLAERNNESTLRYKEAVMYNKKFLTTNSAIASLPYYDPRWMRVFRTAEDIDLDWLRAVEPVDYGYRGDYSAETFLRRVEALSAD